MSNIMGTDHVLIEICHFPDRTIISIPDPDAVRQGFRQGFLIFWYLQGGAQQPVHPLG